MKEISLIESKHIMLDILKDVANFCDKNNLTYYLAYGTLIGAIRHKGFIPWDDDIDIEMPRPDYERFISLYSEQGKYAISKPSDKGSFLPWTKVYNNNTIKIESGIDYSICDKLGIDIDVFPIDGQPSLENKEDFVNETDYRIMIFSRLTASVRPITLHSSIKHVLYSIYCRLLGRGYFKKKYINSAIKYSFADAEMVGFDSPYSQYKNRHRKELYSSKIMIEFEKGSYWMPEGYDEILRDIYGDYMQLPPIEEQVTHHNSKAYWKE